MDLRCFVLAMLIIGCVCEDEDLDEIVSLCGARLDRVVKGLCEPYGGTTLGKSIDSDVSALMPWASRYARSIVCDHRGSSPDCMCCDSFYGPCSPQEIIATFCADPPAYMAKYVTKNSRFRK